MRSLRFSAMVCIGFAASCLGQEFGQEKAVASEVVQQYNPLLARAFAALSTLTNCAGEFPRGVPLGLRKAVEMNCGTVPGSFCSAAGFHVVPGSVRWLNLPDKGQQNMIFAYVARWRRARTHAASLAIQQKQGCLIAIRGSIGVPPKGANWQRNLEFGLTKTKAWPNCFRCRVHEGYYTIWTKMEAALLHKLSVSGCSAQDKSAIYVTGHSLGGAVGHLAMYALQTLGFNVLTSYTFAAPRIGDAFFVSAFAKLFDRPVPVYRVTHANDLVPVLFWKNLRQLPFEVHYPGLLFKSAFRICHDPSDLKCGAEKWRGLTKEALLPTIVGMGAHCRFPMAPYGDMCRFTGLLWSFKDGLAGHSSYVGVCALGGLMPDATVQSLFV